MRDLSDNQRGSVGTKLTLSEVNECVLTKLCRSQKVELVRQFRGGWCIGSD